MAAITNTNNNSYDFLLRQYYSSNRNARKAYARGTMKSEDLIHADSSALNKAIRNLKDMEYNKDNGVSIYNNIKAFVESYNNLYESTDKLSADSPELARAEKKLKDYIKNHKDALEDIGIKVSGSGKLKVDKEVLLQCSPSKVGKVFSDKNEFSGNVLQSIKRINRHLKSYMLSGRSNKKTENPLENLPVTTSVMTANSIDVQA